MADDDGTQEMPMGAEPDNEHEWLAQLVGDWEYEGEAIMAPGEPAQEFSGTESVRSLGELWVVGEGTVPMPDGGEGTTVITLGYDPQKRRFVGTFVGSMMTHLWIYDGELEEDGKTLTLYTEGPDMAPGSEGRMVPYKDVVRLESPDHRVLRSHQRGDDGEWHQFMESHYRRQV